jgi:AraC-like DNA-binding protein
LENFLKSPDILPLEEIARRLGYNSMVLREHFPDLCRAIVKRYRERFNHQQIEKRLTNILSDPGEPPSIKEVARQLGYGDRHFLEYHFPDLCKQISARRHIERKQRCDEQDHKICLEIRAIMLSLHQRGIYPSCRQVSKLLSDPHGTRRNSGHKTWLLTLEELGYSVSHK